MRIALDAMGTDCAPRSEIGGAVSALEANSELEVVLVGDERILAKPLRPYSKLGRLSVVHAPDRVSPADSPAKALRRWPRSSISVGLGLQASGDADAFVSAGSTGAVMAASLQRLGPLKGVDRPAIGTPFPTEGGLTLVLDIGANVGCKPHQLVQFARLGAIYMQDLRGVDSPRIGLLNVGAEAEKGTETEQAAHQLLAESDLNFVGNIEGRDILSYTCDVLVCDGFTGNILLKFYESVAAFVAHRLADRLRTNGVSDEVADLLREFDYAEYGGAPLLGINGVSVICHGLSSSRAISAAIGVAARAVRRAMVSHMARDLAQPTASMA
ncbi:MAG: phosphate acyltransferase PlsX [Gemmatimonadetes bacterium]|nr:phosphate acyltransferase PlsX [Gemmatimonadota bacterium]MCY3944208.1 phosphate acyltransferase PlsX [Gemmatimonadota bacterium]